jgi:hypothetical protein
VSSINLYYKNKFKSHISIYETSIIWIWINPLKQLLSNSYIWWKLVTKREISQRRCIGEVYFSGANIKNSLKTYTFFNKNKTLNTLWK